MTVAEQLAGIFRQVFDDPSLQIRAEMTASDIDGWDSFAHVNLITAVELAFDITLTDQEVMKLVNVGSILDLVRSKTGRV